MLYKPKILVVDDDLAVLENLKEDLSKKFKKFDVVACSSAEEAFNRIQQYDKNGDPIAFVLSDERMPGMSGYEFLKILKETHPKARKGIITAYGSKEHAIKSFEEAGIDFYAEKPWNEKELVSKLESSIEKYIDSLGLELRIGKDIYVREVETRYELEQAFKLRYEVYVEEMGVYKIDKLTPEQKEKKQVWDEFDFRNDVIQIVAMQNGECIGRARMIDGNCPLVEDYPPLKELLERGVYIREVSKLMIKKEKRGTEVLPGILRLIYTKSSHLSQLYCASFRHSAKLYKKIGFKEIGRFMHKELETEGIAMVNNLHYTIFESKNDPEINQWMVKMIVNPVEKTKLRRTLAYYKNIYYKLAFSLTK